MTKREGVKPAGDEGGKRVMHRGDCLITDD